MNLTHCYLFLSKFIFAELQCYWDKIFLFQCYFLLLTECTYNYLITATICNGSGFFFSVGNGIAFTWAQPIILMVEVPYHGQLFMAAMRKPCLISQPWYNYSSILDTPSGKRTSSFVFQVGPTVDLTYLTRSIHTSFKGSFGMGEQKAALPPLIFSVAALCDLE